MRSDQHAVPWSSADVLVFACFSCALLGSAQAVGAVHTPVLLIVSGFVLVSLAIVLRGRGAVWPPAATVLAVAAGVTAAQLAPLPSALVHLLAPRSVELWSGAWQRLGESVPKF